jgi:hypothetical protein
LAFERPQPSDYPDEHERLLRRLKTTVFIQFGAFVIHTFWHPKLLLHVRVELRPITYLHKAVRLLNIISEGELHRGQVI